ncbi:hypothetical protein HAX54_022811, partial [Datura stramonium]|nr:hypothetical protein [Datura stramonium]
KMFRFGLGYVSTERELEDAIEKRRPIRNLPKPIPNLYQSIANNCPKIEGRISK